jgi:putative flippase GtrA
MIGTFLRYNLVQLAAYVFDFGGFWMLINLTAINPLIANIAGKIVAGLLAFIMHKGFTFRVGDSGRTPTEAVRYFLLLMFNIPLSSGVLAVLILFLPSSIAKIASDAICLGITFALVRTAVFRNSAPQTKSNPIR